MSEKPIPGVRVRVIPKQNKLFSAIDVFRAYINHECSYISPHRSVNLGVKVVFHKYRVIFIPIQQRAGYIDRPVYVGRYTPGGAYLSES